MKKGIHPENYHNKGFHNCKDMDFWLSVDSPL